MAGRRTEFTVVFQAVGAPLSGIPFSLLREGVPLSTGVGKDVYLWGPSPDSLAPMPQHHHNDPNLDGYSDWIVFDRSWGTFSESCASLEEARDLAERTGGGPIFRREWSREP